MMISYWKNSSWEEGSKISCLLLLNKKPLSNKSLLKLCSFFSFHQNGTKAPEHAATREYVLYRTALASIQKATPPNNLSKKGTRSKASKNHSKLMMFSEVTGDFCSSLISHLLFATWSACKCISESSIQFEMLITLISMAY